MGPGKTLSRDPIIQTLSIKIEMPKASRGRKCGEGCPLTIRLGVRAPGESRKLKMDFMHILGQKETTWNTILGIFERRRPPTKRRGARENFPPPPLDGPAHNQGPYQCSMAKGYT